MNPRRAGAKIKDITTGRMRVDMIVRMYVFAVIMAMHVVVVVVRMAVRMAVGVFTALQLHFALAATAHGAHHWTSNSRIFISVPDVTCNWWLPHSGQAS